MSAAVSREENLTEKSPAVRQAPYKYTTSCGFFFFGNRLFGAKPDTVHVINVWEGAKEIKKSMYYFIKSHY